MTTEFEDEEVAEEEPEDEEDEGHLPPITVEQGVGGKANGWKLTPLWFSTEITPGVTALGSLLRAACSAASFSKQPFEFFHLGSRQGTSTASVKTRWSSSRECKSASWPNLTSG